MAIILEQSELPKKMADLTIVTYGGLDILTNVFNSIAMLVNGGGGVIRPIAIITASIGGIWAMFKAFVSLSADGLISKYLLPLLVIPGILMIPSATVHIEDILKNESKTVDHVPFLLAKFSELTSSLGYQITKAIETVMHVPNDISYNSTGMIFGAETVLDISKYKITNADLEQNLRRFARQCLLYDVALGRYSMDDLKKTTDLWSFLKERTSNVRMIQYADPKVKGAKKESYLSCKASLEKMAPLFEKEKKYHSHLDTLIPISSKGVDHKKELIKHLPLAFQVLTGIQKSQEELISQQLMMNVLAQEYDGSRFAKSRAHDQQKSTYLVLGSLASSSLVTMRSVIEVLIYTAFLFVIPLALLPGGIKFISTWLWLVIWIQLWPPFYAILNYVMHSVSQGRGKSILYGLSQNEQGLSFFTSIGLQNLHEDIFALSGYLAASIPFLSYAILQGGVQSFMQIAGSMMTPAHSAATSASSELSSGNYSLANTSFAQTNYGNTSAFQKNLAPALSSGFMIDNFGNASTVYAADEIILKQANSDLRTSFFSDDMVSQNLQRAQHHAVSNTEGSHKSYMESVSNHSRAMADFTEHLAKSENFADNSSLREAHDIQESAKYLHNIAENWGKQHGLNARDGLEALTSAHLGLGIPILCGVEGRTTYNRGSSRDDVLSSALSVVNNEDFQKSYQKLQDFSESHSYTCLNDEGARLVEGYTQSLDQVKSSQENYQIALNELNQVSENLSWAESNSQAVKRSLNQDFINWASQKYSCEGGYSRAFDLISHGSDQEKESLTNEFIAFTRFKHDYSLESYQDPTFAYNNMELRQINPNDEILRLKKFTNDEHFGLDRDAIAKRHHDISTYNDSIRGTISDKFHASQQKLGSHQEELQGAFQERHNSWLPSKVWDGPDKRSDLMNNFQIRNKPFWMSEERP